MPLNQQRKKGSKSQAKAEDKENNNHKFFFGKFGAFLKSAGEWGAGISFVGGVIWWFCTHGVWAYWIALTMCPVFIFVLSRTLKHSFIVQVLLTIFSAIVSALFACFSAPTSANNSFLVVCNTMTGPSSIEEYKHPIYWVVYGGTYNGKGGLVKSPIDGFLFVLLTNLKPMSATIDSYEIEICTLNKTWNKLTTINEGFNDFYISNGFTNHLSVHIGMQMFNIALEKVLEPNETASGWIPMEEPNWGFNGELRIRIRESNGAETVVPIKKSISLSSSIRQASFTIIGHTNIEMYDSILYSDKSKFNR